jgi:hypothetical protein
MEKGRLGEEALLIILREVGLHQIDTRGVTGQMERIGMFAPMNLGRFEVCLDS